MAVKELEFAVLVHERTSREFARKHTSDEDEQHYNRETAESAATRADACRKAIEIIQSS